MSFCWGCIFFGMEQHTSRENIDSHRLQRQAMNISLGVGLAMLALKWYAYRLTGSAVVLSDALESVVHVAAVGFAWYSMKISLRPPDKDHHFGHGKIEFFSAGIEGALIVVAAFAIIVAAAEKLMFGGELELLTTGAMLTAFAGIVNAGLGWSLVRVGKKENSLIVTANGKHVLTDAWTSVGAVVGLLAAYWTGWEVLDPIFAVLFAANILYEGGKLLRSAVNGLMDKTNYELEQLAVSALTEFCNNNNTTFHRLRLRETGQRIYVDFHIVFQDGTPIERAHKLATKAENAVAASLSAGAVDVISHLESSNLPYGHI